MTGGQIREIRERLGMSQLELAQALGLSRRQTVTDWECGRREPPAYLELALKQLEAVTKEKKQDG
jgi:DNA-binding transcriptional regulator YiaG